MRVARATQDLPRRDVPRLALSAIGRCAEHNMLGRTPQPERAGWHQMNVLQTGWQRVRSLSHGRDGGGGGGGSGARRARGSWKRANESPFREVRRTHVGAGTREYPLRWASGASAPAAVFPLISWRASSYSR